jgi:uncharacterized protein YdaU (DUF1376 family)
LSELPYMPVVVNDEIAETADLTNEELGAVTRIKWALWKAGGYLADDSKKLARIARAGSRWGKIAPAVMALLTVAGGKVSSASVLNTLLITRERRAQKVKAVNARNRKPDPVLTSYNPLKNNDVRGRSVDVVQDQLKPKSKYIVEESFPHGAAVDRGETAGLAKEASSEPRSVEAVNELNDALYVHGTELLVSRVGLRTLQAKAQISIWLRDLGSADPAELARVLASADQENLFGPNFITVIDGRVRAIAAEAAFGGSLRFGPTAVKRHG